MTICNTCISRDGLSVLMACDSALVVGDRPRASTSKLFIIPHLMAGMSGRGSVMFLGSVFSSLLSSGKADFDGVIRKMPGILAMVFKISAEQARSAGVELELQQQVLMAGWSTAHERMRVVSFIAEDAARHFSQQEHGGAFLSPWEASWGEPPDCDTPPKMAEVAKFQHQKFQEVFGRERTPSRGPLIMARISPSSVFLTSHPDL